MLTITQGDTARPIYVELTFPDALPETSTVDAVKLNASCGTSRVSLTGSLTVASANKWIAVFAIAATDFITSGTYSAQVLVTFKDAKKQSFPDGEYVQFKVINSI